MGAPEKITIKWTNYVKYRANLRGYKISSIEHLVRYSEERYFDTVTRRMIVVGRHEGRLVLVPYEKEGNEVIPITITAELNKKGELIGIEIVQASSYIRDSILEVAQAKILNLPKP